LKVLNKKKIQKNFKSQNFRFFKDFQKKNLLKNPDFRFTVTAENIGAFQSS